MTEHDVGLTWPDWEGHVRFAESFTADMCRLVGGKRGDVLIIKTYMDETGVHDNAPVTAVAAYFSNEKSWKVFTRKWLNALRQFGVTQFHMNDYAQRHGEFEGWTKGKQAALGQILFPLIPAYTQFGVSVAMVKSDFEEIFRDYPNLKRALGHPYSCCFQWLISLVIKELSMPDPSWRLGCIHEDNDYKQDAIVAWDWVKGERDVGKRLGTFAFAPKSDCVPLQAADVLAWESQKCLAEPNRPERKSLATLKRGHVQLRVMDKKWLRENAPRLDALAAGNMKESA